MMSKYLITAFLFTIIWGCTSSPFEGKNVTPSVRKISGKVRLSTNEDPQDVFIWFEGFDMNTHPDENGNFEFSIPPPSAQNSSGGLTGVFNIYFYIANFSLVVKPIVFLNGDIAVEQTEINQQGQFLQEMLMFENLKIHTEVDPNSVDKNDSSVPVTINVILQAVKDSVDVLFPRRTGGLSAPIFFRNLETGDVTILQTSVPDKKAKDTLRVPPSPTLRQLTTEINVGRFPPGKYEIIPYILILNPEVPEGLFQSLGTDGQPFGMDYLIIPFKRSREVFEILAN